MRKPLKLSPGGCRVQTKLKLPFVFVVPKMALGDVLWIEPVISYRRGYSCVIGSPAACW
jgi:hypothetical protein